MEEFQHRKQKLIESSRLREQSRIINQLREISASISWNGRKVILPTLSRSHFGRALTPLKRSQVKMWKPQNTTRRTKTFCWSLNPGSCTTKWLGNPNVILSFTR